jgi:hypothetical protein
MVEAVARTIILEKQHEELHTIFALFENRPYIVANPVVTDYMWEQHGINKAQKVKVQR